MKHQWYYDTTLDEMYENQKDRINQKFSQIVSPQILKCNYASATKADYLPYNIMPIINNLRGTFTVHRQFGLNKVTPSIITTLKQYINQLPKWKHILISKYKEYFNTESLAKLIQSSK